jgi:hypothetical protein
LDAVFYWYRLWVVLDKDLRDEIDNAQAVVDSTVYISFALYVSGLAMLIYAGLSLVRLHFKLLYVPTPSVLFVMGVGCLIIGFVIYRLSLPAHAQFGEFYKSIFDQYRSKLVFSDILNDVAGCCPNSEPFVLICFFACPNLVSGAIRELCTGSRTK